MYQFYGNIIPPFLALRQLFPKKNIQYNCFFDFVLDKKKPILYNKGVFFERGKTLYKKRGGEKMILPLVIQYNYDGSISIAEPAPTKFYDYIEVAVGKTLEEAKQKAMKLYSDYKVIFINEEGDEV